MQTIAASPLRTWGFWRRNEGPEGLMKNQIESFISDLKSNKRLTSFDEASTKQAVVLRLLSFFDWDIFNVEEVYPDYALNSSQVSYALRTNNVDKIFIDVKRINEKLDKFQEKFIARSSDEGVDFAVLTNGITWWFYLTSAEGSWHQKWFYSIDLFNQTPDGYIPQLIELLTKDNVATGAALKSAKKLFQNKKQKMAADFLPKAWNQIVSQPNKIFVELLSLQTEKLCGHKVDIKSIESFLSKHIDKWLITNIRSAAAAPPPAGTETEIMEYDDSQPSSLSKSFAGRHVSQKTESYADKSIHAYTLNGHTHRVRGWEEFLSSVCDYFAAAHTADFEKVLWISDDQKALFSRYSDQLRMPEKIKQTDIFVETKLSPDKVVKTVCKLMEVFGHSREALGIDAS
jgi:hypothetical protein